MDYYTSLHFLQTSVVEGIRHAQTVIWMNSDEQNPPSTPEGSIPKESVSKATSELNNLLQIISGTSAEIENLWEGSEGSEKYLEMLRESIGRAESVAAQLSQQAGGAEQKMLMHPELTAFVKPKNVTKMACIKSSARIKCGGHVTSPQNTYKKRKSGRGDTGDKKLIM